MNQRVAYPFLIVMFSHLFAMDHHNFASATHSNKDQDFEEMVAHALVFFTLNSCAYLEQENKQASTADTMVIAPLSTEQSLPEVRERINDQVKTLFQCRFGCEIELSCNSSRNRHERTVHPEYATHKCATCYSVFFSKKGLEQHILKKHSMSFIQNIFQ